MIPWDAIGCAGMNSVARRDGMGVMVVIPRLILEVDDCAAASAIAAQMFESVQRFRLYGNSSVRSSSRPRLHGWRVERSGES